MAKSIILGETPADETFLKTLIDVRGISNVEVAPGNYKEEAYGADGFELRLRDLIVRGVEKRPAIILFASNNDDPSAAFVRIHKQICDTDAYVAPAGPNLLSSGGMYPPVAIKTLPRRGEPATHCVFDEITQFLRALPLERPNDDNNEA
jgi:hypothetical protein